MDSTEPTQKECDSGATTVAASTAPTMPRVPFVGRLHLYIPHPTKSFPYLHFYPSPAPSSATTAVDTSLTPPLTPPSTPPSSCEPEQHLEEVEPIENIVEEAEEEEGKKIEEEEDVEVKGEEEEEIGGEEEEQPQLEEVAEAMEEDASTTSSTLWRRKESTEKYSKANNGPVMTTNSVEYVALLFSFLFLLAEGFLRVITLALRKSSFLLSSAFSIRRNVQGSFRNRTAVVIP
jgi:hypothetical protein